MMFVAPNRGKYDTPNMPLLQKVKVEDKNDGDQQMDEKEHNTETLVVDQAEDRPWQKMARVKNVEGPCKNDFNAICGGKEGAIWEKKDLFLRCLIDILTGKNILHREGILELRY